MYPYLDIIIEPLLKIVQPDCMIEIGCESGHTTKRLLAFCEQHQAVLHGIDPSPLFDSEEWKIRSGKRFIFHRMTSLQALPLIHDYNVVLIDGNHNWYTVYHELKLIEKEFISSSRIFPFVLLHDVGWPYGRRDMYYNPETIPEEFRHPIARMGIHPNSDKLLPQGGINSSFYNAVHENGPRNGVLTAVEDFQREFRFPLELLVIPGFHGLGILFPSELKHNNPALGRFLDSWNLPDGHRRYLGILEEARLHLAIRLSQP